MVIPWVYTAPLLIDQLKPTSQAKFVRFETVLRPNEMPVSGPSSPRLIIRMLKDSEWMKPCIR